MDKVKYTIFSLIAIVLVLLIVAFILPREYRFHTEVNIEGSKPVVFNLIANLEHRRQWDPIVYESDVVLNKDSNSKVFEWSREKGESGKIIFLDAVKDSIVLLEKYIESHKTPSRLQYKLFDSKVEGVTVVSLDYIGDLSWPRNLFTFIQKKILTNQTVKELNRLEIIAKERRDDRIYNGYKLIEDIVKERNFIIRRDEVPSSAVQQFYLQNLAALSSSASDAGLQIDGMPSGLFYTKNINSNVLDMAAGIPVSTDVNIAGAETLHIKTRRAIIVDYYGDYNFSILAHNAIKEYMIDQNYTLDLPIIEEYITDPVIEKDPNKWLTKITYYISSN